MQLFQMILMLIKRTTFWIVTILIWDETLVLHRSSHHVVSGSSLICVVELLATFFAEVWDHLLVVRVIYRILTPGTTLLILFPLTPMSILSVLYDEIRFYQQNCKTYFLRADLLIFGF